MPGAAPAAQGRIGPNAITRAAEALDDALGPARRAELFHLAGLGAYVAAPPQHMVLESEVTRLHQVLYEQLGPDGARRVSREAGVRTGRYLLEHRIPAPVRFALKRLPAALASRVLVEAIRRHAWTFAGTATFKAGGGRPVRFTLTGCPLCRGGSSAEPRCDFYVACFEHLFRALVHRRARAIETSCASTGSDACRFELTW